MVNAPQNYLNWDCTIVDLLAHEKMDMIDFFL